MGKYAMCKFCGQTFLSDRLSENATEDEALEVGTEECRCFEAELYRKKCNAAYSAKEEIDNLFLETDEISGMAAIDPQAIEIMKTVVDMMVESKIVKMTLDIPNKGKASLGIDAKGKFSISREMKLKKKREAE